MSCSDIQWNTIECFYVTFKFHGDACDCGGVQDDQTLVDVHAKCTSNVPADGLTGYTLHAICEKWIYNDAVSASRTPINLAHHDDHHTWKGRRVMQNRWRKWKHSIVFVRLDGNSAPRIIVVLFNSKLVAKRCGHSHRKLGQGAGGKCSRLGS